ncbi:MAG: ComEC/Rec2 family competence protein [bacterium]|nr:ComEC/Rec2 family competence protein [bacterium]
MIEAAKKSTIFLLESKSRIFFCLLVSFIAGIAFRSFVSMPIEVIWAFFILGVSLSTAGIIKFSKLRAIFFTGFFLLAFSAGMLRHLQKNETAQSDIDVKIGSVVSLTGVIGREPVKSGKSQQLVLEIPKVGNQKVLVITRPQPEFNYGDEIKLSGVIERPENFSEDFDYRAYLAKDDIYFVTRFPRVEYLGSGNGNLFFEKLFSLKRAFADNLNLYLPEPEASFASGLILGERRAIPQKILDEFAETGTTHIIALSGYNITIIASAIMKVLGFLSLPSAFSMGFSAVGIVLFTLLTGASASVVRAAIMGLLILIAQKEGRMYSVRNALALAGAMMLFQNPAILRFDTSFQLSFLATLGLLYASPVIDRGFQNIKNHGVIFLRDHGLLAVYRENNKPAKASLVREIFVSTLSAQVLVLPLLLHSFGRLSLVSPVANLLVLPVVPLEMLLSFITGFLGFFFTPLAVVVGWAGWAVAHYQLWAIGLLSRVPAASLMIGKMSGAVVFMFYAVILYWLWKKTKKNVVNI